MKNKKIKKRQFSLLEVIIAITIVALVATIAVQQIGGSVVEANQKLATTQIAEFKNAIAKYQLNTGRLPGSLQDLVTNGSGANGWKQVLEIIPKDPWGNEYQFSLAPETFNKFEIICYGADGQPGGEGENLDITLSRAKE